MIHEESYSSYSFRVFAKQGVDDVTKGMAIGFGVFERFDTILSTLRRDVVKINEELNVTVSLDKPGNQFRYLNAMIDAIVDGLDMVGKDVQLLTDEQQIRKMFVRYDLRTTT